MTTIHQLAHPHVRTNPVLQPLFWIFSYHLREGIVPQDSGFGIVVLVAMDNDHQRKRQGLKKQGVFPLEEQELSLGGWL